MCLNFTSSVHRAEGFPGRRGHVCDRYPISLKVYNPEPGNPAQGGASSGYDTDDDASVGQHSDALSVELAADSGTTGGGRRSSLGGASTSRPDIVSGAQSPVLAPHGPATTAAAAAACG